jgi:ABC-type proline/glycine betaine transport system permease subunit
MNTDFFGTKPTIPVEDWAEALIGWLNVNLDFLFGIIAFVIEGLLVPLHFVLLEVSPIVVIAVVAAAAWYFTGWRISLFIAAALLLIGGMGYWEASMITLSLVLVAALLAVAIGIPLGIVKAHVTFANTLLEPVLDFMQTMPLFVYLIPAVLFFSIGNVSGVVATIIFATPPAVRLTALGIEQIPKSFQEAGQAFGASAMQMLWKVEIPLAMPSIMAGVNQTIMLALSMVVVAALVGAEGLGSEVVRGIQRLQVGQGIASGIAVVLLAMILDRLSRRLDPFKRAG